MRRITYIIILSFNFSFAQSSDEFLSRFVLESELDTINKIDQYKTCDFSSIWTRTENKFIYGIFGQEHLRLRVKLITVSKNPEQPNEYLVYGKSYINEKIQDFEGLFRIVEIRERNTENFDLDDDEKNEVQTQGVLTAEYELYENETQTKSSLFSGTLYSKWFLDLDNTVQYDDINFSSYEYMNNAFVGIWRNSQTGIEEKANWADYRVPNANHDFDIGIKEFNVSREYWGKGWLDIVLRNQAPNHAIIRNNESINDNAKEWWE